MELSTNEVVNMARNYFTLDNEIQESMKALKLWREKKDSIRESLLQWLQKNNKNRITTPHGSLERVTRKKVDPVKPEQIVSLLQKYTPNANAEITELYDRKKRTRVEGETLQAKKKKKVSDKTTVVGDDA